MDTISKSEQAWQKKALENKSLRGEFAYLQGIEDYRKALQMQIDLERMYGGEEIAYIIHDLKPLKK